MGMGMGETARGHIRQHFRIGEKEKEEEMSTLRRILISSLRSK
jgi:hypothetical protein